MNWTGVTDIYIYMNYIAVEYFDWTKIFQNKDPDT